MGDEEFDDTEMDAMITDDNEALSRQAESPSDVLSNQKRRLLEERLAQRQLEKQIQDYDFELA
ncbi:MAG: hypothetical protein KUG71_03495 [Porticoccaceae bacterium]|nr:hypothetical protein [Porticoccaceae bacterium]